jgi:hypothetical protein
VTQAPFARDDHSDIGVVESRICDYGFYAAVVRARRRRATAEAEASAAGIDADGNDACEARGKGGGARPAVAAHSAVASEPDTAERRELRKNWAALIRRVYEVDPLVCPCGATMRIVAVITERSVITKILAHLAKVSAATSATEGAAPGPSRPPPTGPAPAPSVN